MKSIFTLFLFVLCLNLSAQWSDTNNQFYDSLHMPVSTASGSQMNSIVIKSYPDSGYIIFWEDMSIPTNNTDIYAQKYDKYGNRLWAMNGIPVASGPGSEQIAISSNVDYRNYSHAVTDSAGGFFITYVETARIGSYYRTGIAVQHINATGDLMFPNAGQIIRQPTADGSDDFGMPQLVADGKKGFYISFTTTSSGYAYRVSVEGYKITGNTLTRYVSQVMNDGVYQKSNPGACGLQILTLENYPSPTVYDYHLWPDTQGGCNIVMNMSASDGGINSTSQRMLAYNALKRVKKDCITTVTRRTSDVANEETVVTHYPKDSVIRLYNLQTFSYPIICIPYTYTNYQLETLGLGYNIIISGFYDGYFVKGVTATAPGGNININAVAVSQREYLNDALTPFVTKIYTWPDEIYDSIPYQRASSTKHYVAYNTLPPDIMNSVNYLHDTILSTANYFHDFNIVATGNKIYTTAKLPQPSQEAEIYLQELEVIRVNADSFAVNYKTPAKTGVLIGKERNTLFGGSNIAYDNPMLSADDAGNLLFYIGQYHGPIRVSPIIHGTELAWGAMGRALGSGIYNESYYAMERPFVITNPNGTGVICWDDERYLKDNSQDNIFMRHLDNLIVADYSPPLKSIKTLTNGSSQAWPSVLLGSTKAWSIIESYTNVNQGVSTPVVQLLDNYNLGGVDVYVYENNTTLRSYNGKYYLDRNYTINPQNNPAGESTINLRLFFTNKEFDALKAADISITDPSSLIVIKQSSGAGSNAPAAYIPVAGEEIIEPSAWQAVDGGYYIEIAVNSFSNFFIESAKGALPVTWLGIQAQWISQNEAKVSWQVADQKNVKNYTVQQSLDGTNFSNVCNVGANNATTYSCNVPATLNAANYYRVQQTDIDGKNSLSKIVTLASSIKHNTIIYPNPAKDHLYIRNDLDYSNLVITDLAGKIILKKSISKGLNNIQIDQIPAGSYFIRLSVGDKKETLKFVKE